MRVLSAIFLLLFLSGCASMASQGAMIRAQDNFAKGDYQDVINITERSIRMYEYNDEETAQLLFLKAQSFQKMNDVDSALSMFAYIVEKFPKTEHGFRAQRILASVND